MVSTHHFILFLGFVLIGGAYGAPFVFETNQLRVINTKDDFVITTVYHIPAEFGPSLSSDGLRGVVARVSPADACGPVSPPPGGRNVPGWIAVIRWPIDCRHTTQVANVERAGYAAAIVGSAPNNDNPAILYGKGNSTSIPAVSVAFSKAEMLVNQYNYTNSLVEVELRVRDIGVGLKLILPLAFICLVAVALCCCSCTMVCISKNKERLQFHTEAILKEKTFKKGDYQDTCTICLDKFTHGQKTRVLPCEHTFHQACVDRWLKEHTPTCPLCKRHVLVVAALNIGALPPLDMIEEDEEDRREGDQYLQEVATGDSHTGLAGALPLSDITREEDGREGDHYLQVATGDSSAQLAGALPPSEMTGEDEEDGREGGHFLQVVTGDSHTEIAGGPLPSEMAEERRAQVHLPQRAAARNPRTQPAGRVGESSE